MPGELFETLRQLSTNNPFLKFMGVELIDAGEGWVKMKIPFRPEFMQPIAMHGGAIYSLADSAAAHALMTMILPDQSPTTVEQRINFLKAGQKTRTSIAKPESYIGQDAGLRRGDHHHRGRRARRQKRRNIDETGQSEDA